MSDTRTLFLYTIITNAAKYVVAAHGVVDAKSLVKSHPDSITVTKIGCVTADVTNRGELERGVLCREWLPV